MTETALVHIYKGSEPSTFVGCGALVDGGLIATYRHVWRDAQVDGRAVVLFPRFGSPANPERSTLSLAEDCNDDGFEPDLVLLAPSELPGAATRLNLAREERFECGAGFSRAELPSRGVEATIRGTILPDVGRDGRRQFSGALSTGYWFEPGSSGAPLFLDGGQQLAGIASVSEVGSSPQGGVLREAFVVPGTLIWRFVERSIARQFAEKERVTVAQFSGILEMLGLEGTTAEDLPKKLEEAVASMKAYAKAPVPAGTADLDIDKTLRDARSRVGALDVAGGLELLKVKSDELAEKRRAIKIADDLAATGRVPEPDADMPDMLRTRLAAIDTGG